MRRARVFVAFVAASVAITACAAVLGIEDRPLLADGGADDDGGARDGGIDSAPPPGVTNPSFAVRAVPSVFDVTPGVAKTFAIELVRDGGFGDPITITIEDASAPFTFAPTSATNPTTSDTVTVNVTADPAALTVERPAVRATSGMLLATANMLVRIREQRFDPASGAQTLVVPESVTALEVSAWGAGGLPSPDSAIAKAGAGGFSEGIATVSTGDVWKIVVGAPDGGGAPGTGSVVGGAGGGFSGVFRATAPTPGTTLPDAEIVVVAGGGGGAATDDTLVPGGGGGGATGEPGASLDNGGTQTGPGIISGGPFLGGAGRSGDAGGAGGGGGFYGGGGGFLFVTKGGSGGGGSGHLGAGVTSSQTVNAAGTVAGNAGDPRRGTAGDPGRPGLVIVTLSP